MAALAEIGLPRLIGYAVWGILVVVNGRFRGFARGTEESSDVLV